MNSYDFQNRVAIITGGGQGIGHAVAKRILEGGGKISVWDIDQDLLDGLSADLGASGDRLQAQNVDISDKAAVDAATENVITEFGKIDVLVNNAAIVGPNATTWEYPDGAFEDVVRIGLLGTYYVSKAVIPHMVEKNYGRAMM
jgi:3-oxoacyl-[acyl-carrier protein] reductase